MLQILFFNFILQLLFVTAFTTNNLLNPMKSKDKVLLQNADPLINAVDNLNAKFGNKWQLTINGSTTGAGAGVEAGPGPGSEPDICAGINCVAQSPCHAVGTCTDGICDNPFMASGETCDDTNADTDNDICDGAGTCAGTDSCADVTCIAQSVCHDVGTCTNGVCSDPLKANGEVCDDLDANTENDTCDDTGGCAGTIIPPINRFISAGMGCCRKHANLSQYGCWGSTQGNVSLTTTYGEGESIEEAAAKCAAEPACFAYWPWAGYNKGWFQYFCSTTTALCGRGCQGSLTQPSDLVGKQYNSGQTEHCFIKATTGN